MALRGLCALAAVAVASASLPNVDTVTLNDGGGEGLDDGISFYFGMSDWQLIRESRGASYPSGDHYAGVSGVTRPTGAEMIVNSGIHVAIGSTAYSGDADHWLGGMSEFATMSNEQDGPNGFRTHFTVVKNDLEYAFTLVGEYTAPNPYATFRIRATIPESNEEDVRFYVRGGLSTDVHDGSDTPVYFTGSYGIAPTKYILARNDNDLMEAPLTLVMAYLGGAPWTGYIFASWFCGTWALGSPCAPEDINQFNVGLRTGEDYVGQIASTTQNPGTADLAFSINFGSAAGTYSSSFGMAYVTDEELQELPEVLKHLTAAPPLPYAQFVAHWIGFAFFLTTTVIFVARLLLNVGAGRKVQALACLIAGITALAYLIMALSDTTMTLECGERTFQWVRYAAWGAVAPLTIAYLGFFVGAHSFEIVWGAVASELAVVALFAGAVSPICVSAWPLLAFAAAAGLVVLNQVWGSFRTSAKTLPAGLRSTYTFAASLFTVALVGYIVVWGTAEGGKVATDTQEVITYTVLDILTKAVLLLVPVLNATSYFAHGRALAWLGNVDADIK